MEQSVKHGQPDPPHRTSRTRRPGGGAQPNWIAVRHAREIGGLGRSDVWRGSGESSDSDQDLSDAEIVRAALKELESSESPDGVRVPRRADRTARLGCRARTPSRNPITA